MTFVLIVDDDKAIRETLCLLLEEEGYGVLEAANGEQALVILRHHAERLVVLLDQMMPKLDGMGVLLAIDGDQLLRQRHAFILVSAAFWRVQDLLTLPAGMVVPRLRKPFEIAHMLAAVSSAAALISVDSL